MKPQSAKAKGRNLQKKVASDIIETFPQLESDDCFSTSMGAGGEDVKMSPLARSCIPLSIECKNQEKVNIWGAFEQAKKNCPEHAHPCVIFKKNHSEICAMVSWKVLLDLYASKIETTPQQLPKRAIEILKELNSILGVDLNDDTDNCDNCDNCDISD